MFIYPTGTKNITSPFRPPGRPDHNGVDFADGKVHNIVASASGTITRSAVSTSYGEVVYMEHTINGRTWETRYAHMVTGSRTVSTGDRVTQGRKIGVMGSTGDSTGLHLHFEMYRGGVVVDPMLFLDGDISGGDITPIVSNERLGLADMENNAQYIAYVLVGQGWSPEAIAGMLGNMQTESTINPGRWQSGISYDDTPYIHVPRQGYGLVQWTPFNNFTVWARDNGWDYDTMDAQLDRIIYEVDRGLQWIVRLDYPITFKDFIVSTKDPEYLAQAFLMNYERPANQNQPARSTQARYWYDLLDWSGVAPGGSTQKETLIKLLLCDALNGWKF